MNETGAAAFPEQYIGFTWSRGGTSPYDLDPVGARIYLVRANPPNAHGDPTEAGSTVIQSSAGGWAYDTEYQFRILYTTDLIRVYINDVLRLEATAAEAGVASFSAGQFGFTNASQANVLFGNVREADASALDSIPVAVDDLLYYGLTWGADHDNTNIFDTSLDPLASGILDNDYDPDGDPFVIEVNGVSLPNDGDSTTIVGAEGGTFQVYGNGRLVYTAPAGYESRGPYFDSFDYTLVDEDGEHTATVTLAVQETNTTPDDISLTDLDTSSIDDIRIDEGAAAGTPIATIATIENETGEIDAYDYELADASDGAFGIVGNTLVVRDTTALGGPGTHSIVIRSTDVEGQPVSQTFTITVDPNALPTSDASSVAAAALVPFAFGLSDFPFADSDGDTLGSVLITSLPSQGTLFLDLDDNGAPSASEAIQVNFNDVATRAQITGGVLKYLSSSSTDVGDSFQFRVGDGTAYAATASAMTVSVEADSDNDGIPNVVEGVDDTNDDGEADYLDPDSDGDGIDDAFDVDTAGGTDANGNGVADGANARDTDGDAVPDYRDLDSDNDALTDVFESLGADEDEDGLLDIGATIYGRLDANGDGRIDVHGTDVDGDGIADAIDGEPDQRGSRIDNDNDGVPANRDRDDDGDGIADDREGDADSDGDNTIDRLDRDADNDSIADRIEMGMPAPSGSDADLDGIDDAYDADATGGSDSDGDGIDDRYADRDSDGDGVMDRLDDDSDNDGLTDMYEVLRVQFKGADFDGDGIDDAIDADATGGTDANGDGADDATVDLRDTDGDGLEDYRDPDSDNDGVIDGQENGDFNKDGIDDRFQADPGLKTGLKGGGSFGWLMLIGMLALGCARRATRSGGIAAAVLLVFTCGGLQMPSAQASETSDEGCRTGSEFSDGCWSAGIGLFTTALEPDDSESGWQVVDDRDSGYKLSIEYHFWNLWFLELGYADLGSALVQNLNPSIQGREPVDYQVPSLLAGRLLFDPANRFNVHVKAGYAMLQTDAASRVIDEQRNNAQLALGGGIRLRATRHLHLQAEYEYYDKDARQVGLMLRYAF